MSRWSKNHILKGGTSPYSLCMGVPPWVYQVLLLSTIEISAFDNTANKLPQEINIVTCFTQTQGYSDMKGKGRSGAIKKF